MLVEKNWGTYWSAGELRKLEGLARAGMSPPNIAYLLQRSVGGVKQRLAVLRTAELYRFGGDSDTLVSVRKDPKFNFGQGPKLQTVSGKVVSTTTKKGQSRVKIGKN